MLLPAASFFTDVRDRYEEPEAPRFPSGLLAERTGLEPERRMLEATA